MLFIITGLIFLAIGFAIHKLKWYFLISGYNTMSKEKQEQVDVKLLGKLIGIYGYSNGAAYILAGILDELGHGMFIIPVVIFTLFSSLYLMAKGRQYTKAESASKQANVGIVIVLITILFVGIVMYRSLQLPEITILDEGIEIDGMYGDTYLFESIEDPRLMDELPTIKIRTNGAALGSHLKGHFTTEEYGLVKLHVDKQYPPFIYMVANGRTIVFNTDDAAETKRILEEIRSRIE